MDGRSLSVEAYEEGFRLSGHIDENADLGQIIASPLNLIKLDLGDTTQINSYGVKKWIIMLNHLKDKSLVYVDCPVFFINQVNLVHKLISNIKIESLYLPIYCATCDHEADILFDYASLLQNHSLESLSKDFICPRCQQPADFCDDINQYLGFMEPLALT